MQIKSLARGCNKYFQPNMMKLQHHQRLDQTIQASSTDHDNLDLCLLQLRKSRKKDFLTQINECYYLCDLFLLCVPLLFQKCFPQMYKREPQAFKAHLELSRDLGNRICGAPNWSLPPLKSVLDSTLASFSWCQHHELSEDLKDLERHCMSLCGSCIFTHSKQVTWLKMQAWGLPKSKRHRVAVLDP